LGELVLIAVVAAVQKMMGHPKSKSVMVITSADANVQHNFHRCCKHNHECREMMTTLGTPELVLVLIALGRMTAAATWGVIELKRPRR
jgi:hypothetical protein